MSLSDESDTERPRYPAEVEPARVTRGTLTGCLGILCVLTLPGLLFIPIENLNLPVWATRLPPLIGVGALALGAWLLARVPVEGVARSADPLRPLTSAGTPPLVERPATRANRLGFAAAALLALVCAAGYLVASVDAANGRGLLIGALLASGGGSLLLAYGALVAGRRAPAPALRWVSAPIRGGARVTLPLALIGLAALIWGLLIAVGAHYGWALLALELLLIGLLVALLLRRIPRRTPRRER